MHSTHNNLGSSNPAMKRKSKIIKLENRSEKSQQIGSDIDPTTDLTHCNTLQHTATHCSTLQHTAAHCNTLQHTATHYNTLQHTATHCNTLQHTATHCITLQHTASHCNTLQHTASHCNTLQHTTPFDPQICVKDNLGCYRRWGGYSP